MTLERAPYCDVCRDDAKRCRPSDCPGYGWDENAPARVDGWDIFWPLAIGWALGILTALAFWHLVVL
jgi:hypothetical protein